MSTQELSSIAVHVVGQYNLAGKALVNAYRSGAQRLLSGATERFAAVTPVTSFLATRLEADTAQVVTLMDKLATAQTNGLETLAARVANDETPGAVAVRDMLVSLHMPVANVSAQIADKLLESAQAIEARVGQTADAVVEPVAAKPARRAVRKAA